jgi:hypothetical protein
MAVFRVRHRTPLGPDETWRRLTDWTRHAAQVPLTTITVTPSGFVARTGLGRVAFDDPMEVVSLLPPGPGTAGRCRLEKRGTFVTGWAEIEVRARDGGTGSVVIWTEDLRLRILPPAFDRPTAWAGRHMFGRVIRGLLAD